MTGIKSHIVYVGDRRVHYRRAGHGPPVVLLHLSPSWARSLDLYTAAFAARCTAIALDTPGYGLSDPLPLERPAIGDFADALRDTLDVLGIERCSVFGSHTGATIAVEFALRYPERCSVAVFDGYPGFTEAQRTDYLAHYFESYLPRDDGTHLLETWHKFRSIFLFSPTFKASRANRANAAPPSPEQTQSGVLPRLIAGENYTHAYRAVFEYDSLSRLGGLAVPTCFAAREGDSLVKALGRLGGLPSSCWLERLPRDHELAAARYLDIIVQHSGPTPAPTLQGPPAPASGGIAMRFVDVADRQVAVRRAGPQKGLPLVIVPHLPGGSDAWEPLLPRLAVKRPIFLLDLLGNGDADDLVEPPTIESYASHLDAFIAALSLERVALLGHGSGASIVAAFAVGHPERVSSLILRAPMCLAAHDCDALASRYVDPIEPTADGRHLTKLWHALRGEQLFWPWYDERLETIRDAEPDINARRLTRQAVGILKHYRRYSAIYAAAFAYPLRDALPAIKQPTLVCSAENDVFDRFTEDAAQLVPGASLKASVPEANLTDVVNGFLGD